MRQLLGELGDWSAGTRLKAAATLVNVLVYAEEKIGVLAEPLLAGLCKACMDDEHEVPHSPTQHSPPTRSRLALCPLSLPPIYIYIYIYIYIIYMNTYYIHITYIYIYIHITYIYIYIYI